MSSAVPTRNSGINEPEMSPSAPFLSSHPSKPQRVLACVRCQQRKIKCNRMFPCAHCSTSRVNCVAATLAPRVRRRRRFPERELLERVRKYEDILRQNNINFEPLHKELTVEKNRVKGKVTDESDEHPEPRTVGSPKVYEDKYTLPKKASEDEAESTRSLFHSLTLSVRPRRVNFNLY